MPSRDRDLDIVEWTPLHDLVLSQTCSIGLHCVTATRSLVFDEAQSERTTTVLVTGELFNGSICTLSVNIVFWISYMTSRSDDYVLFICLSSAVVSVYIFYVYCEY